MIIFGAILFASVFLTGCGDSGSPSVSEDAPAVSSDKPKACDCVDIIYEGPDMTWFMKDETDDAMMAESLGWSKEKFNKWKKCRDAYPGPATVTLECDKEKYKASH